MKQRLNVLRLAALGLGIFAAVVPSQIAAPAETSQPAKPPSPDQTSPVDAVKPAGGLAQPPFTVQYEDHLTVRPDRTATEISTRRIKVLTRNAVQTLSQQQLQFIEGMQQIETVEAFTEKSDGRRIPVNPANIITRDGASGLEATYVPDLKVRTIIFPDVSVGDTLVMTNKGEILQDEFSGQLTYNDNFPRSQSFSSVQITIEAPDTVGLAVGATGNATTDKVELVDGVRRHSITIIPEPYEPEEPGAVSPLDREPALMVSTFRSYDELGKAYGDAAFPRAKVTPEIAALAAEITKNIDGRLAQAVAIDAWMKKNIRYVAVYLSVGARVVPHEAEAILHNRFGDCKDKVTLMTALLAAKGIASEAALINLGNSYTLHEPPTLASLNHVILYLPQLDEYDDPTASGAAFGVLAPEAYDKPVVRVSASGAKVARTPAMRPGEHLAHSTTTIHVAADGAIIGRTQEDNTGVLALGLRYAAGLVQQIGPEQAAQRQLQNFNTPGTGHIDLGNSAETVDPVTIVSTFALNNRFKPPAPGGVAVVPVGMPLTLRPGNFLFGPRLSGRKAAFSCYAGSQIEDIEATFDKALPLPAPSPDNYIGNELFTYWSTFKVENRTLKIHRQFISLVPGQSCSPETEARIAADLERVRADVNTAYRFPAPVPPDMPTKVSRTIVTGQKRLLDFLYAMNLDCSSMGLTAATVIEPPQHGQVTVEPGTGTSIYPPSNPRFECNKRQSEGTRIFYEPAPGFVGVDAMTLEARFPGSAPVKRRYLLTVNPDREATPAPPVSLTPIPPPILYVTRFVTAGQQRQLDTFFSLNPDCSSQGATVVTVVEPPQHGRIAADPGTGTTDFAPNNPQYECNKRQSAGTRVVYDPAPGFTGVDSVTVEIRYPGDLTVKRRYTISVDPARESTAAPGDAPAPPTPAPTSTGQPLREISRVAVADQLLRVGFFYDLNPDCSLIGVPTIRIVEPPKSGRATIEKGDGFPSFPANNLRFKCNSGRVDGAVLVYMPNPGYTGSDTIVVEVIFPDGVASKRNYAIEVK